MMKRTKTAFFSHLLSAGLGLIVLQCPTKLTAQYIHKVVVTPSNPLPSDTIKIAVNGYLPMTGIVLVYSSMSIIGNMIQIRLNFDAISEFGLTILVPYSRSFKVGKLLSGNYTVRAQTYFRRQPKDSLVATFTVQSPTNVEQKSQFFGQTPAMHLLQNYPNPFNPSTTITYTLPQAVEVKLEIFDMLGRHVRTLMNQRQQAGRYAITWDGRNEQGEGVASGTFIYQLRAGTFMQTRRMALVR